MKTYRMDDGTVVKTENAMQSWDENNADEGNYVEHLYRSRKGRYWLEHIGIGFRKDYAEWISNHSAVQWLLANGYELPEDLKALEAEVSE